MDVATDRPPLTPERDMPDRDRLVEFWRCMYLERALSDRIAERNAGSTEKIINIGARTGQEAVMTGFCLALRRGVDVRGTDQPPDMVCGFGGKHLIPMGLDLGRVLAEGYGKATGYGGGRAGPGSAVSSPEHGVYPHLGLIGVDPAHGVGFGFAAKWNGRGQVVGSLTTDGGVNAGRFHEALNIAALHALPVIFVVQNNWYAYDMPVSRSVATGDIAGRSRGYGFPSIAVDGMDVLAAYRASLAAVERARRGEGPTLLEFQTYRFDAQTAYAEQGARPTGEVEAWRARDPIPNYRRWLRESGNATEGELAQIEEECRAELDRAFAFADASPLPVEHEVAPDLYAPLPALRYAGNDLASKTERQLTFAKAINEAEAIAMRRDRRVVLFGLNVGRFGNPGDGHSVGLWQEFGEERVIDFPIAQGTYTAAATALAMVGYRPIVIPGSPAISMAAADELLNVIPNARFVTAGRGTLPLVARIGLTGPGGGRFGNGPTFGAVQHNAIHGAFVGLPGIYVAAPSTPFDVKGLLLTAIALDDPVYFIEHRGLMRLEGPVPEGEYFLPFGQAAVRRTGTAATAVAVSWMVGRTLAAAEILAREGIEIEVIDPRTLVPLDAGTIFGSVARTGYLATVDQGFRRMNVGAEIITQAFERLGSGLRGAVRISAPDSPVPAAAALSGPSYPTPERIAAQIREMLERKAGSHA